MKKPKTRKNFYKNWRKAPTKFNMVDYVKVPSFTKKQEKEVTMVFDKTIDEEMVELFKLRNSKLMPQDDYYTYVNELWLKNVNRLANQEKTFYVKQDNIRIMQEKTAYSLLSVLKMNPNQKKVFHSFKNIDSTHMTKHVDEMKQSLQTIFDKDNFYDLMVFMHKNSLFSSSFPLIWEMSENLKNSKVYCNNLVSCNLTFFDFAYYENISKKDKKRYDYQQELFKKYENNAGKTPVESMNWNQIYKDYDGLEICPYLTMKYGKLFQEIHYTLSFKQKIDIAEKKLGKIPAGIKKELNQLFEDNPKYFKRIWCIGWEVGSGVIWKNYAKIAGI